MEIKNRRNFCMVFIKVFIALLIILVVIPFILDQLLFYFYGSMAPESNSIIVFKNILEEHKIIGRFIYVIIKITSLM